MNLHLSLPEELADFIEAEVAAGHYGSSGDVVTEALRLLERIEKDSAIKLKVLRKAYQDGLDSGDAGELDFAALKAEARNRLAALKT